MESDTITPSAMRYSDQYPMAAPVMDLNYSSCLPSNGASFGPNSEIRIPFNVPTDCFVDTKRAYIKMTVRSNVGAVAWFLDPFAGIAGFIDNMRVVSGTGSILSEIIHYNELASILNSSNSANYTQSVGQINEGLCATPLTVLPVGQSTGQAALGEHLNIAAGTSATFTHRPIGGFWNADKYLPLGFSQGTSYVSLTLAGLNTPMCCVSGNDAANSIPDWTISNVEMVLPILRPGNEFAMNFRTLLASGMPINIHSVDFQNTQQTLATSAAAGTQAFTFATRKRSVKSIITACRRNASLTNHLEDSLSSRRTLGISQYQFSIGGVRVPSAPINVAGTESITVATGDIGQLLTNQQQALGHYNSNLRAISADRLNYARPATSDDTLSSKCVFAVDLEQYEEGLSGKNMASQGLPLVLNCQTGAGAAQSISAALLDTYIVFDTLYTLDGVSGTLMASN